MLVNGDLFCFVPWFSTCKKTVVDLDIVNREIDDIVSESDTQITEKVGYLKIASHKYQTAMCGHLCKFTYG